MPHRYKQTISYRPFSSLRLNFFSALRERLKEGYGWSDLRADLMSGAVVAMVAIPLGMALAIASGVPPQHGLYTVIVGGAIVALLGGSRFQVTGPTAAFVVILAPISQKFGVGGLLVAGMLAGLMLLLMGLARTGRLIQFIPHPVTTGFTSGIAVVIATLQLKDFLGLKIQNMPERYLEKVLALIQAGGTVSWIEFLVGAVTLISLLLWPKINRKIPAPLVILGVISVAVAVLKSLYPNLEIATIGSRFSYNIGGISGSGIPQALPKIAFPWLNAGPNGAPFELSFSMLEALMLPAFAIAMLGAIESLLSAVVADGMAQTKHDPDAELIALGIGNIACPFFGGIAATGAIARTATNIRFGAKSPLSAFFHAGFTLIVVLLFAPYVSFLPMAALAALLMLVAYNMSDFRHFIHILKVAPKSDMFVLLTCFGLTVMFDMVMGVMVGIVLASLLFMKRMAALTTTQAFLGGEHPSLKEPLPQDVVLYEVAGPLFFGAAQRAAEALSAIGRDVKAIILSLENVPAMDITGLVALESTINKLSLRHTHIYLVGLRKQPRELIQKSDLIRNSSIHICRSLEEAINEIKKIKGAQEQAP